MSRFPILATALVALLPAVASAQEIPAVQPGFAQAPQSLPSDPSAGDPAASGEVPREMPPSVPVLSPQKPLDAKQKTGVRLANKWIKKVATPNVDENGVIRFLYGQGEPVIVCAPLRLCDLALEPGEIVRPPLFLADKRWSAEPATSGSGSAEVTHVLLKPSDAGLITNLVIHTNRRSYSVKLVSRNQDYMPQVAFDYPAETNARSWEAYAARKSEETEAAAVPASPCDQPPSVPPSAFTISGDDVPWKPVQVYVVPSPVGEKTCIQLPADIGSRMLPALVSLGPAKGWFSGPSLEPINARFSNNRYVVDSAINNFVLVDGVGSYQQKITVERKQ
jgi:type IV secretion system protein TrbG